MNKLFFLAFLFLLNCSPSNSEESKSDNLSLNQSSVDSTKLDLGDTVRNYGYDSACTFFKSGKEIKSTFPFSESDRVDLVAFDLKKRYMSVHNDELIVNEKFVIPDIEQSVRLEKNQVDSLFSILYDIKSNNDYG